MKTLHEGARRVRTTSLDEEKGSFMTGETQFPIRQVKLRSGWTFIVIVCSLLIGSECPAGEARVEQDPASIRVEVFLARDQKENAEPILERFREMSVANVHFQFFRAGRPPANIAIGRNVPAGIARLAIELAIGYAQGIKLILPQELLPTTWIGIGTSAFDEQNQIPISEEGVKDLRDPSLRTDEFHDLYRRVARRQPVP